MKYCCTKFYTLCGKGFIDLSMMKDRKLRLIIELKSIHTDKTRVCNIDYCLFCGKEIKLLEE